MHLYFLGILNFLTARLRPNSPVEKMILKLFWASCFPVHLSHPAQISDVVSLLFRRSVFAKEFLLVVGGCTFEQ